MSKIEIELAAKCAHGHSKASFEYMPDGDEFHVTCPDGCITRISGPTIRSTSPMDLAIEGWE